MGYKEMTPEQLVAGLELNNKLETASKYDDAEIARGFRLGYTPDYNFGLAALSGTNSPDSSADIRIDGNMPHFGDGGKLPSHPTFSDQAALSGSEYQGGKWEERDPGQMQVDTFYPSRQQLNKPGFINRLQGEYSRELSDYIGSGMDQVVVPPPYKGIDHNMTFEEYIHMMNSKK